MDSFSPTSPHPSPLPEGKGARGGLKPTLRVGALLLALAFAAGCVRKDGELGQLDKVFGRHGISDGRFQKPRAMTIDRQDRLYICDMTARIQVFDAEGNFLRVWQTPAQEAGRPTGLSIGIDGNLLVADTHYYRVLVYSPQGRLLWIMGGAKGDRPGQFGLVTSAVQDRQGNYYVAEYGECDRIQEFAPDGRTFLRQWGRHGEGPGEFSRPQKLALDQRQHLWVCDACNHRIQVFDGKGKLLLVWGRQGSAGRVVLSLRSDPRARRALGGRVRQQPHPEVHPRRPPVGLLGIARPRRGSAFQSLGPGPRQPRADFRVGHGQSSGAASDTLTMENYRITFESPGYLLLLPLVLVLVLVPWVVCFSFRRLPSFGIIRRLTAIALRTLVVMLLIMALAEVQMVRISDRMTVLYLVDESLSVPEDRRLAEARYVNAAIRRHRHGGDRAGVIVFGREAAIELPPYDDAVQMLERIESPISGDNTDISAAMRLAEASFPEDSARRVVLVSDGSENLGNAMEQAQSLVRAGVGIDVLPIRFHPRGEIIVERVTVPNDLRLGQPFDLKVVITNTAEAKAGHPGVVRGKLQVSVTEQGRTRLLSDDLVELPPGKKVFTLRPKPIDAAGFYNYTARFIPLRPEDDAMAQNNRASGFTQVRGKGQVLVIEDGQHRGQFERMVEALRREKLEVTLRPSGESFAALAELQQYDAVLLANVPRDDFSDEQIAMLVRNTQQLGCGLLMLGATGSFGAGDWAGSELEKAMPVDFQIKNLKVMPRGALAMLMHASEVAEGNFWQKKIAQQAIGALGERDFCGVIHFDNFGTGMKWLWSPAMSIVGPNRNLMTVQLDRMMPGDMPDFEPGMKACLQALLNVQEAAVRHVIVISDGDPQPPSQATINALVKAKITVSTVAVGAHGPAESRSMASIASQTGGKYYKVNNPNALPKIFQREARRVAQPLVYKNQKGFQPKVVHYHDIVNGISNPLPPITGYVLTSKKENPLVEVLMRCPVPGKEENCTLLASWPYGLGKSVAFTTDSGFSFANQWTGWDDYDKLFGQMVRWAMRPVDEEGKLRWPPTSRTARSAWWSRRWTRTTSSRTSSTCRPRPSRPS